MADFTDLIDLASERLGGSVVAANDEFFAPKEALLKATLPEWREGAFTERGKWMDGWETRRRRSPGHDWAIIRLGASGVIRGVVIDTTWFTGNYPESASIDATSVEGTPSAEWLSGVEPKWEPLLERTNLKGNAANLFEVDNGRRFTHLRLNIFPDGGVARLRVHGDVIAPESRFAAGREVDLAAMVNGGFVVECSDMHYGHRQNLILPGRSTHMADGWETKRRRGPGNDWSIDRLARRGTIERVEIDTDHSRETLLEVRCSKRATSSTSAGSSTRRRRRGFPSWRSLHCSPTRGTASMCRMNGRQRTCDSTSIRMVAWHG